MRRAIVKCDRCGTQINNAKDHMTVSVSGIRELLGLIGKDMSVEPIDWCHACFQAFAKWLEDTKQ